MLQRFVGGHESCASQGCMGMELAGAEVGVLEGSVTFKADLKKCKSELVKICSMHAQTAS